MAKTQFVRHLEAAPRDVLGRGFTKCAFTPSIANLGTAENHLLPDYVVPCWGPVAGQTVHSLTSRGCADDRAVRRAFADLFEDCFGLQGVDPDLILFGCGVSHLVECLSLTLCDPGDVTLIPKPGYPFGVDIHVSGSRIVYIDLNDLPPAPPPNAKFLLLTNPGNPFGDIIPRQAELLAWASQSPGLHIVTDEVYALSNRKGAAFRSIAGHPDADPQRVHLLYGISKDWCMAGVHIGVFWTRNADLFDRVKDVVTRHYRMASHTIAAMTRLLSDKKWRDAAIAAGRQRLIENERTAVEKLRAAGFNLVTADNAFFIMIEVPECTNSDAEMACWRQLIDTFKVHVVPAMAGFAYDKPGWFRLCFTLPPAALPEAVDKLINAIAEIRRKKAA